MLSLFPAREVALALGEFEIRWYGVLYVAAFVLAWRLALRLQRYRGLALSSDDWLTIVTVGIVGVLAGGRLGYVLFYEPGYFLAHPARIFFLTDGGMSSHGGFIGVAVALWLSGRRFGIDVFALADTVIVPAALGLALGRLGNFINQELYVSTAAHLTVIGKDLLIAGAAFLLLRFGRDRPGTVTALFLMLYGILRFLTEYVRRQDFALTFGLTRGQLLTLPVLAAGALLMLWLYRREKQLQ